MSEDEATTVNIKGLDQILKALKKKMPVARVGILGSKDNRVGSSNSNAAIGAAHEFGTSKMPQRSFLRVPLMEMLDKEIEASDALDAKVLADVIATGTLVPWLGKIAILAEGIVRGAFDSNGYGKWAAWKAGYTNNTGQILVDTTQLRNSITSEVR